MARMYFDNSQKDSMRFRKGDRVTVEELEQRAHKSFEASKEAMITLAEYLEEKGDTKALELLENFSQLTVKYSQDLADHCNSRSRIQTIDELLSDPDLKGRRGKVVERHRGALHWTYYEGCKEPVPTLYTELDYLTPPSSKAAEVQKAANQIVEDIKKKGEAD